MLTFSDTDTLLPDEHTASLDPARAELITKHTSDIIQRFGLTTLMVTHNMQQAVDMGDRLIMMDKGEIILDVSGEEKSKLTVRSEEHTSELQSRGQLVCRLLLEKKKIIIIQARLSTRYGGAEEC